ncbi:MAG: acetyl-CoA carboxylase biotin carboxyl carrier protein subunit [Myxococcales bacterium]|nr:MAG: acetyl-CoA carboxylase biotin carboxyl carrier protein subunit [Myxococcales bacterium]
MNDGGTPIVSIDVEEGAPVGAGQKIAVLEAMKMANDLTAPSAGVVAKIHVAPGSTVKLGQAIITLNV